MKDSGEQDLEAARRLARAEAQRASEMDPRKKTWKMGDLPSEPMAVRCEPPPWKVADLLERMQSEDPEDIMRDECLRVAGRLESRGWRHVRLSLEYGRDESELYAQITAKCPCGRTAASTREHVPRDLFTAGPHELTRILNQMEEAMGHKLDQVPGPARV
jgi:hypothetical protein